MAAINPAALIECVEDSGDTAFMTMSMAFVFLMIPGLAFFEAGLLKSRSVLSIMMQVFAGIIVLSILFFVCGFSLTFGPDQRGLIGNFNSVFFSNMPVGKCFARAPTIPAPLYALYEMMFQNITPLLITGAFAERLSFKCFLFFVLAWTSTVYFPVAHWIWGNGWLQQRGVLDFAGGITVHTTAGAAAVVSALYLGERREIALSHALKPHSVPLTMIGGAMLWFGWFGFNAGSTLRSGGDAAVVAINTHIAACTSGLVWLVLSWWREGRAHTVDVMNGVVAGLAGITPVCGYCTPPVAFVVGLLIGIVADVAVTVIVEHLHVDDALEVSAVHGCTGAFGSLAIGFVTSKGVNPSVMYNGLFYGGGGRLLGWQLLAILVTIVWSSALTYLILVVADRLGLTARVSKRDEEDGLDFSQHEGHAYLFSNLAIYEHVYGSDRSHAISTPLLARPSGTGALGDDIAQMARRGELMSLRNAIAAGADANATTKAGRTLVHEAAECNQSQVIRYLVEDCHVGIHTRDAAGRTPLDIARAHNAASCVILLERLQASINF
eukprot:Amastigsp_a511378_210.p1 type:complete len:551 gc:universal Amastigsp_a511378_210:1660-8(-)